MTARRNVTMQRFAQLSKDLQREVRAAAVAELNASADALVEQMRAVAPLGRTGNLRRSIRKEPGKRDTVVRVMAGGPLTTVGLKRGVAYDYTRGIEFGTQDNSARPFFYPSWRLRKKTIRSRLKRRITKNIKAKSAQ